MLTKSRSQKLSSKDLSLDEAAFALLRSFGTGEWGKGLETYLLSVETLKKRYAQERRMKHIPVVLAPGTEITLSPGGQNVLVKQIIDEFCPRYTPGGRQSSTSTRGSSARR